MRDELEKMNIPTVTTGEVVDLLVCMYLKFIENKVPLKKVFSVFLWGPAGVGKSQGIHTVAKKLEETTGKRVVLTDMRLATYSHNDLGGIPYPDGEKQVARWLKPVRFDMEEGDDLINILFLDELSSAAPSVQAVAYQICLDRCVGEHKLPSNCIVIGAGNRMVDGGVSYKMSTPLCNRFMHLNVRSGYSSWRKWALENGIAKEIIAFIGSDPGKLHNVPQTSAYAFPTPRSWEFASDIVKVFGTDNEKAFMLIAGCVGEDMALEFRGFCRGTMNIPDINKIFKGNCFEYPSTNDAMYALTTALIAKIYDNKNTVSVDELENVCRYVMNTKFPKDFLAMFMSDLRSIKEINHSLAKCYNFQVWLCEMK